MELFLVFGVYHFIFLRILQLICLLLLQHALGSLGTPWAAWLSLGPLWDRLGTPLGPPGVATMPSERSESGASGASQEISCRYSTE